MRLTFDDADLESLFNDENVRTKWAQAIVRAFREVVQTVIDAPTENQLRGIAGLRFKKLRARPGEYAMRLDRQWRLIVTIENQPGGNILHIKKIEDYHD